MGTRGAIVLVGNGCERTVYNHGDSYPEGLGTDVLGWLRAVVERGPSAESLARDQIAALEPVPDRPPTAEERARFTEFHNPSVSTGSDWYALLRKTQGDVAATLRAGVYEPADGFPLDSLFCEWAYVVDFDARVFEVYRGSQTAPPTAGRWVGHPRIEGGEDAPDVTYYPVQRVAAYAFDTLPDTLLSRIS